MKCLRNKKRRSLKKCQLNQTQLSRWHTTETYWACQCSALLCGFHSCCRTMLILISNWRTIRFHLLLTWNRWWAVGDEYRVTEGRTILRTNEAVVRALACASWQCARPNDKSFHRKDWTPGTFSRLGLSFIIRQTLLSCGYSGLRRAHSINSRPCDLPVG